MIPCTAVEPAGTRRCGSTSRSNDSLRSNRRFTPQPLPGEDYTTFLLRDVASTGWRVHARITVFAPAEEVLSRINATVGVVEKVDEDTCILVTGADSIELIAVYIGMLGIDFRVTEPPELVAQLAVLGARYARSVTKDH